jgi:hypothetical protein
MMASGKGKWIRQDLRKGHPMVRLLLILALCLFLQDQCFTCRVDAPENMEEAVDFGYPEALTGPAQARQEFLAGLAAMPFQGFPAAIPWYPLRQTGIHAGEAIEKLLRESPVEFLQMCLDRFDREVQGYSCIMAKTERPRTTPEVVQAYCREKPFSVFMNWLASPGKAQRVLYVEGENKGKMLAVPSGLFRYLGIREVNVDDPDVRKSGRYLVTEFGIKLAIDRTLRSMRAAQARGTLHVQYKGIFRVPETGDRLCYKVVRVPYDPPEDDGVYDLIFYIDIENWLQVGSILKDSEGKLIADYFFRDIRINPTFAPNQFQRSALEK